MKRALQKKRNDDLRSEYDLSQLKGGVRGKYYREATAGTNLVLIDLELTCLSRLRLREPCALASRRYRRISRWHEKPSKDSIEEANQAERLRSLRLDLRHAGSLLFNVRPTLLLH